MGRKESNKPNKQTTHFSLVLKDGKLFWKAYTCNHLLLSFVDWNFKNHEVIETYLKKL